MKVYFKPTFVRKLKSLELDLQDEVIEKIELFKDEKKHKQLKIHKLHGVLSGKYSFSVNYKTRIIFFHLAKNEVVLLTVGDHEIYKK